MTVAGAGGAAPQWRRPRLEGSVTMVLGDIPSHVTTGTGALTLVLPLGLLVVVLGWGWRGDAWSWLMGSTARLRPVWRAYHIAVQPAAGDISHTIATYLVDASGNERAAFLPPIAVGELVGDVDALRSAGGA